MSIWTEFSGMVKVHKDEHFSMKKSFKEVFDESYIRVIDGTCDKSSYRSYIFVGNSRDDLEGFLFKLDEWYKMFPKSTGDFELTVTNGRVFK